MAHRRPEGPIKGATGSLSARVVRRNARAVQPPVAHDQESKQLVEELYDATALRGDRFVDGALTGDVAQLAHEKRPPVDISRSRPSGRRVMVIAQLITRWLPTVN